LREGNEGSQIPPVLVRSEYFSGVFSIVFSDLPFRICTCGYFSCADEQPGVCSCRPVNRRQDGGEPTKARYHSINTFFPVNKELYLPHREKMYHTGDVMPRKKEAEKTVQSPLVEDLPAPAEPVRKKTARKEDPVTPAGLPQTGMIPAEPVSLQRLGRFPAVKDIPFSAPIPTIIRPRFEETGEIIRTVCRDKIDDEYYYLGILLLEKLARKRPSPLLAGKTHVWAAGILCALGTINFLFDKSSVPYIRRDDLAGYCGVNPSTASEKSRQIRDLLKMNYWDSRFSTQRMQDRFPLKNLIMPGSGFILNIGSLFRR
jgi:hypothetical protein